MDDSAATSQPGLRVEAFGDFYRACRTEMVRALVLAVGDQDLGREAADEAFTRAMEHWDDVADYANPRGWVYRVGLNWARSRQRRRRFESPGLAAEPSYRQRIPEPELLEAVEELPLTYRAVVVARFFLDWSIEDTAAALDLPEGTVKTRQHRALKRLRKKLGTRP